MRPFAYPGPESNERDDHPGDEFAALEAETALQLAAAADLRAWDAVRVGTLGKSGTLTGLLKGLGQVPAEQRKERGAALNRLKGELEGADRGPPHRAGGSRARGPAAAPSGWT